MSTTPINSTFPGDWADSGACKGQTDIFFLEFMHHTKAFEEAQRICKRCPVKNECYEHALHHVERGIWAGHGPRFYEAERKRLGIDMGTNTTDRETI